MNFMHAFSRYGKMLMLWMGGVAIVYAGIVASCQADTEAEVVDRIVAFVNQDIILLSELEKAMSLYATAIRERQLPADTEKEMLYRARQEMLDNLIDRHLIQQRADALGVTVDEREVDDALERMKRSMLFTDEDLRQSLAEKGYTLEVYRNEMKEQILRQRVLTLEVKSKVVITPVDIQAYYETHPEEYSAGRQYHLRNIIMRVDKGMPDENRKTISEMMEKVHARLQAGEPFETLARQYSQSSFAEKGGDLGFFAPEDLAPQLREAVEKLQVGEFTSVLDTPLGYQILYLEEIQEKPAVSLEEAADEIREKLYEVLLEDRFEKWVTELREKSHIKVVL